MWESTTLGLGTERDRIFCARTGPLQIDVVLVFILFALDQ